MFATSREAKANGWFSRRHQTNERQARGKALNILRDPHSKRRMRQARAQQRQQKALQRQRAIMELNGAHGKEAGPSATAEGYVAQ